MKSTDVYQFPYPEGEDFGDGSTQMAALATAIDASLQDRIDAYTDVLRPPTYIMGRTTPVNYATSPTFYHPIIWDTTIYSSDTLNLNVTGTVKLPSPGVYQVGMFCWLTCVGAATANSLRNFKLEVVDYRGPSVLDEVTLDWQQTTLEAATGVAATLHAVFPMYSPERPNTGIYASLQHFNAASQMTLQSNSYIWVNRLGDLVV